VREAEQVDVAQRVGRIRVNVDTALLAQRVALQVTAEPGVVVAEAVVVQACVGVEVVTGPAQVELELAPFVDFQRAVRIDAARPPDDVSAVVLDGDGHAQVIGEERVDPAGLGCRLEAFVIDEEERNPGVLVGINVDAQGAVLVALGDELVFLPVVTPALTLPAAR
jgi:hypothetical protein